jgi:hypothetical protein
MWFDLLVRSYATRGVKRCTLSLNPPLQLLWDLYDRQSNFVSRKVSAQRPNR